MDPYPYPFTFLFEGKPEPPPPHVRFLWLYDGSHVTTRREVATWSGLEWLDEISEDAVDAFNDFAAALASCTAEGSVESSA